MSHALTPKSPDISKRSKYQNSVQLAQRMRPRLCATYLGLEALGFKVWGFGV